MKVLIESIERVVLLGGGNLLLSIVNWCTQEGVPISVITSPRHHQQYLDTGSKLIDELQRLSVPYLVTSKID